MDSLIVWCGFVGAWLLVAGPLYQGAIELLEHDHASAADGSMDLPAPPAAPSVWWWFLPPVMFFLRRRRSIAYRREVLAHLTPEQQARRAGFLHKAAGTVAVGGLFIATKETGELVEHYEWPTGIFVAVLIAVGVLIGANTVYLISRRRARTAA